MSIDYENLRILNYDPFLAYIDNAISPSDCDYLINQASDKMLRAKVSLDDKSGIIAGRSGKNCWLRYSEDERISDIGERISSIVGIPLAHAESLQMLHYGVEQEYRPHFDAYDLTSARGQRCCTYGGQRLVTALAYLNTVTEGGGTAFPNLDKEVVAKQGRLVIFYNTNTEAIHPHPTSLHAGMPVVKGEKWAFNIWFHAHPMIEKQTFDNQLTNQQKNYNERTTKPEPLSTAKNNQNFLYKTNRAKSLFQKAADNLSISPSSLSQPVVFTYWDSYGNKPLIRNDINDEHRCFELIDRKIMNPLADKAYLPRLLVESGKSDLAPATYNSVEDALKHSEEVKIWFVKNAYGSGGKDMFCLLHKDLSGLRLKKNFVIQAGVENLKLMDDSKFTTRIYCVIWDKTVYLYHNGFTLKHGEKFDPNSIDYKIQIDHKGYQLEHGPVKMEQLVNYVHYRQYYPEFKNLIDELRPVFSPVIEASSKNRYALLGIDVLLQGDGKMKMIEINTMPNLIHSKEICEEVNIPLLSAVIETLLGNKSDHLEAV